VRNDADEDIACALVLEAAEIDNVSQSPFRESNGKSGNPEKE